jgi:hypothetical protein
MFYIFGVNIFALLFAFSVICFALYSLDLIQGRVTRFTRWSDLTFEQWIFSIGILTAPIWIVGMFLTVERP